MLRVTTAMEAGIADHVLDLSEVVELIDSLCGTKIYNVRYFFAVGERFPFAIFVKNRHTPEIFTLNPIATIYFWKLICGKAIIHTNY
jgi:hypothetical protein